VEREKLYRRLAELNTAIDLTVAGIVAARAAILVPGAGQAAGASEEALLRANAALRAAGDSAVLAAATKEYAALRCAANSWSREEAACGTTPPLAMAFERARTPFPDVAGALHLRGGKIGQVRCAGRGGLVSQLALTGNPGLRPGVFGDRYEQ
jgi:hypothetical protein